MDLWTNRNGRCEWSKHEFRLNTLIFFNTFEILGVCVCLYVLTTVKIKKNLLASRKRGEIEFYKFKFAWKKFLHLMKCWKSIAKCFKMLWSKSWATIKSNNPGIYFRFFFFVILPSYTFLWILLFRFHFFFSFHVVTIEYYRLHWFLLFLSNVCIQCAFSHSSINGRKF